MFHENTTCSRRTALVASELYYWHDTQNWCGSMVPSLTVQPAEHFENPETKRRLQNLVQATGLWEHLSHLRPKRAADEVIRMVHPQSHIDHLASVCERGGGDAGELTPAGPASLEIARLAVGGVIVAMDAVMTGAAENAYVLCRPPGHHALPDLAMGFCLLANAALGIRHVQKTYGLTRIAVVDWDVHHGNGTEAVFLDDPGVLTISLHQDNLFPLDSGGIGVKGAGNSNINVPLPPGSGSGAYREAFEQIVIPALDAFAPELIVLPCGYDASAVDPLGVCMLSSEDFRWMTRQVMTLADKHCQGRIVVTHEGGYSPVYVPYCGLAVLEELSGASDTLPDPYADFIANYGGQALSNDQAAAIKRAKDAHFSS
ncbi:class II histone deacetylase [Ruegeria pomeroyi]|uniref:Histone deacetylase/AcuC/AphA family protein n=2 Tax=Ruegeria pomeroyi TaxID=89184 RepID=Q5LQF5_RUEPO|nr:class II histone deacetylase [Ruegeria pomeroyi]HCE70302.1 class II histone deacetylase [Ruegeria sp.]AAV95785.1 histone deacetylase/AcuC/AphA family protein [Ruegeria pomeroyi DSS-3]NVK98893.1 class II histone deacetylase [Ruegeria pomeroyi]NVL03125.1 class II histone deacetylase [Ruegeria pomeroyi]QWV09362.1 class II histone deacetylase [Ruegeria pomeroyi]